MAGGRPLRAVLPSLLRRPGRAGERHACHADGAVPPHTVPSRPPTTVPQENDIILCDGMCNRAYHVRCLVPPVNPEELPEDEGWLCPACDRKVTGWRRGCSVWKGCGGGAVAGGPACSAGKLAVQAWGRGGARGHGPGPGLRLAARPCPASPPPGPHCPRTAPLLAHRHHRHRRPPLAPPPPHLLPSSPAFFSCFPPCPRWTWWIS